MKYPIYTGVHSNRRDTPAPLPVAHRSHFAEADQYFPDPGLVDAVNVALLLGQPLLLTGEPGTGKTQLAYSLARELGFNEPVKFETKSTCTANDLFYTYDSLRRFQDANERKEGRSALDYLTYNAFGIAILRASREEAVKDILPKGFVHGDPQRTVVLIDEVDKAPRDFPNDILSELENMYFRIPELGNVVVQASPEYRPVVIITSNSEKDLPDAFLRRCIYYHISFPEDDQLRKIIAAHLELTSDGGDEFLRDALTIFRKLRSFDTGLRKRPATAELLGWLKSMRSMRHESTSLNPLSKPETARRTLSTLVKTADDLPKARQVVDEWISERERLAGNTTARDT